MGRQQHSAAAFIHQVQPTPHRWSITSRDVGLGVLWVHLARPTSFPCIREDSRKEGERSSPSHMNKVNVSLPRTQAEIRAEPRIVLGAPNMLVPCGARENHEQAGCTHPLSVTHSSPSLCWFLTEARIHPSIHPFLGHVLTTYCVPGTV